MFVQPRHHLRRLRQRRPAVHPGDDLRAARRRSTSRTETLPRIRPFLAALDRACSPTCSPGSRRCARTRRRSPRRSRPALRSCATRPSSTRARPGGRRPCVDLNNDALARDGIDRLSQTNDILDPPLRFITPAQTVCNYATLLVPQRSPSLLSHRQTGSAPGSGSSSSSRRRAPTTRAALARRRRTAGRAADPANFLHVNPYPNTAAPGQDPTSARRQRGLHHRPAGDRQRARQPGHRSRRASEERPGRRPRSTASRHRQCMANWVLGADPAVVLIAGAQLPRLHQASCRSPIAATSCTATFENAATPRDDLAGADRRRQRRQGHRRSRPTATGAKVTFTVDEEGQPIHADAEVEIRPRLFLEGNFFLDLRPGSPSAPELADGGTIPLTQTATAVQLDEVLTALQSDRGRTSSSCSRATAPR